MKTCFIINTRLHHSVPLIEKKKGSIFFYRWVSYFFYLISYILETLKQTLMIRKERFRSSTHDKLSYVFCPFQLFAFDSVSLAMSDAECFYEEAIVSIIVEIYLFCYCPILILLLCPTFLYVNLSRGIQILCLVLNNVET